MPPLKVLPETLINLQIEKCKTSVYAFLYALTAENGPNPRPNLKIIKLTFRTVRNVDLRSPTEEIRWMYCTGETERKVQGPRLHALSIAGSLASKTDEQCRGA
jgi:hypothetical protein